MKNCIKMEINNNFRNNFNDLEKELLSRLGLILYGKINRVVIFNDWVELWNIINSQLYQRLEEL